MKLSLKLSVREQTEGAQLTHGGLLFREWKTFAHSEPFGFGVPATFATSSNSGAAIACDRQVVTKHQACD